MQRNFTQPVQKPFPVQPSDTHINNHKTYQQNLLWPVKIGGIESSAASEVPNHSNETFTSSFDFDSRSYDPYLIAYHEDTNTFTYNDPWVQDEIVSNDNCINNNEINCNVIEEVTKHATVKSVTFELEIPPQPIDRHDTIENGHDTPEIEPPFVPETKVEHVQEVSFPCTHRQVKFTTRKRKFSNRFSFSISISR